MLIMIWEDNLFSPITSAVKKAPIYILIVLPLSLFNCTGRHKTVESTNNPEIAQDTTVSPGWITIEDEDEEYNGLSMSAEDYEVFKRKRADIAKIQHLGMLPLAQNTGSCQDYPIGIVISQSIKLKNHQAMHEMVPDIGSSMPQGFCFGRDRVGKRAYMCSVPYAGPGPRREMSLYVLGPQNRKSSLNCLRAD